MEELKPPARQAHPEVDQSARYRAYLRERVVSIATLQGFYKTTVGALTMEQVVLAQQIAHNKLIRLGFDANDRSDQTDWLGRLEL